MPALPSYTYFGGTHPETAARAKGLTAAVIGNAAPSTRIQALHAALNRDFPLDAAATAAQFSDLAERLRALHAGELAAAAALGEALR